LKKKNPFPTGSITAIIADDEPLARQLVAEFLDGFERIEVIAECENGRQTVKATNLHRPDLLFLDIQMPGMGGFEVLEHLRQIPSIIFSTAYDRYALKAFEVNAVDYLLKPYDRDRFELAVERALANLHFPRLDQLASLVQAMIPGNSDNQRLLVKHGNKLMPLDLNAIICIEAADDYTVLRTANDSHLSSQRLHELEARLAASDFIRIHRATLLNIHHLQHLEKDGQGGMIATLTSGIRKRVSRRHASKLRDWVV